MTNTYLERTPVEYSPAATKTYHFNMKPHSNCFRMHWHDRIEILRIKSGHLYTICGTTHRKLSKGELLIIPPKTLHRGYTLDENAEYDVLMFDIRSFYNETEVCKQLFPAIYNGDAVFHTVTSDNEIIQCCDSVCNVSDDDWLEVISKIYKLISLLYQKELVTLQPRPKNTIVKKITEYFEENISHEINIDILCKGFGYTAAHLCRVFKQTTGLPPMSYLKIYRLEVAHNKLKFSNNTISDIAADCGFSDPNYFTRCFKEHFGMPPTIYRQKYLWHIETK